MPKKKNNKGAGHQDVDEMTKTQLRAYHKEINEYYVEHGWRATLSHFALSPKQAGEITERTRQKLEADEAKAKEAKKKARAAKAKEAAPKKKAKAAEAKEAAPKKKMKAGPAAAKAKQAAPKKKATSKKASKFVPEKGAATALHYLLEYRKKNSNVPLDTVIADLATLELAS